MLGARRLGLGLVALLLRGSLACWQVPQTWAGSAHGTRPPGSIPNPTSTNIPYLAWRGENIRLVKCSDDLQDSEMACCATAQCVVVST